MTSKIALKTGESINVTFKKVTTQKENLFIKAAYWQDGKSKSTFFYLKPDLTRFYSPKEVEAFSQDKPWFIPTHAWISALENWTEKDGLPVRVHELNAQELEVAMKMLPEIIADSKFGYVKPAPVVKQKPEKQFTPGSPADKFNRRYQQRPATQPAAKPSNKPEVKQAKKSVPAQKTTFIGKGLEALKNLVTA